MDNKDKQIQELSYENIQFRQLIERQEEENKRLLSIIEQVEKAIDKSIVQMRDDAEDIATEMGYRATDSEVILEAIEALKAIRGN